LKNGTVNNFGFLSAFLIKKHYYYGRAATKKILFFQFLKNHFTSGQALHSIRKYHKANKANRRNKANI
ncbi:MAG TPA: hypothetical protein VJK54_02690, partial [Chthoniobacterales bacterium]|nr:hypothetical protein [Chthoniobacterales bacterium]